MSDPDDKNKQPGTNRHEHHHDHDHDHPHDHAHDHHHEHSHDHGAPEKALLGGESTIGSSGQAQEVQSDDAGSMALADALKSSFGIVKVAMVGLVVVFCFSGVFMVKPQERAVVFRFGNPVGPPDQQLLGPGLHFALPRPIDEVERIPTKEIQTVQSTVGWYATTPEEEAAGREPSPENTLSPSVQGYTLTGDANIIHVRATLRYLITDPLVYKFHFTDASNLVLNVLNNALFYASSRLPVDKALDVVTLRETIRERVNAQVSELKLGVTVQDPEVKVKAPLFLKESFEDVVKAAQKRDKSINMAHGYATALLSRALGESNAVVNAGAADRAKMVSELASDARTVSDLAPSYTANPRFFIQRRLSETMLRVLTNSQDKFYLPDRADGAQRELRLLLSREPAKPSTGDGGNPGNAGGK